MTQEFKEYSLSDWLTNSKWFDIRLLTDSTDITADRTLSMSDDTYSKAIKKILKALGIQSTHWLHLGRVTGPKMLELQEMEPDEIRRLGNWDPYMQEKCYSAKLPLKPMRAIAGFTVAKGMYYNPRTTVKPPLALVMKTPFQFAFDFCDQVGEAVSSLNGSGSTAHLFLRHMKNMAVIFIQDAATIWIQHPTRRTHPLYNMDVFRSKEWEVSFVVLCCKIACHQECHTKDCIK